ncbi:MAG TPA: universal stress protein [Terracidiphilus sp.]|jgi:nucleotide-binding universal stress UspA family protein|nr:universal stress protein [Terracidiphilus sp.]
MMSFATGLKTIVVATDLSGQSEAALEYARKLATNYGARIVLAHGADPLDYAAVDVIPGRLRKCLPEEAREVLDKLAGDLLLEGIHSHSEIRQGAVAQMLVDVARQYEAGLIVIGTKGMQGAGPVVVGAIAEQLVRLAPCPVLAVAADWNAGQFRPTPGGPVLLAMERNEATSEAVATAYSLAQVFKRPLLVVHARSAAEAFAFLNPCATSLNEFGVRPTEDVPVRCMVKDGNPEDAIVAAIAQHHPSILVAGVKRASETPGRHGTAFALMARSRVPVLCVPPEAAAGGLEREAAIPVEAT